MHVVKQAAWQRNASPVLIHEWSEQPRGRYPRGYYCTGYHRLHHQHDHSASPYRDRHDWPTNGGLCHSCVSRCCNVWVAVDGDNSAFPFASLATVAMAMLTGDAVTVLYTHDAEVTARTLFPSSISYTKDHRICVKAFCTLRREVRSFRLDRMTGVHLVTLPGENSTSAPDKVRADDEAREYHCWQDAMAHTHSHVRHPDGYQRRTALLSRIWGSTAPSEKKVGTMAQWHVEKRIHLDGKSISYRVKAELPRDATGKRQTKGGTFATRKEADAAGREWSRDADNGIIIKTTTATFAEIARQWLDMKRHDLKPRTLEHYEATVKTITARIGILSIQKVQPANLDALYALLRSEGKSEDALHQVHLRLAQVFDYATKRRIIAVNPMHAIDSPTVRPEAATILSAAQIARFLSYAANDGYSPLWLLLVQTGMRRGEAIGLRWSDLDLERGKLTVRQTVEVLAGKVHISTPKTAAAVRTITLFPESLAALKTHHMRQLERRIRASEWENNDLVFCTDGGKPLHPDNVYRNLKVIQKKANDAAAKEGTQGEEKVLPAFCVHDLRHTHASHLLAEGWNIPKVSRRLGHANAAITMKIYAHALNDDEGENLQTPAAFAFTGTA